MPTLREVVRVIFSLIIAGLVFGVLWWLVHFIGLPPPFGRVAEIALAVLGAGVLIGILLDAAGFPLVKRGPPTEP